MRAILYNIDAFAAFVNSKAAMQAAASSETAMGIILDAITHVCESEKVLLDIKTNLSTIGEKLPSLENGESAIPEITSEKERIDHATGLIQRISGQADLLINNIDTLCNNTVAMAAILNSNTALNKIKDSATAMEKMCASPMIMNLVLKDPAKRHAFMTSPYLAGQYDRLLLTCSDTNYFNVLARNFSATANLPDGAYPNVSINASGYSGILSNKTGADASAVFATKFEQLNSNYSGGCKYAQTGVQFVTFYGGGGTRGEVKGKWVALGGFSEALNALITMELIAVPK